MGKELSRQSRSMMERCELKWILNLNHLTFLD